MDQLVGFHLRLLWIPSREGEGYSGWLPSSIYEITRKLRELAREHNSRLPQEP